MEDEVKEIKKKIYSTFADVARSIGYSPIHGQIIAVLLVKGKSLSLQELAEESGYSSSMISLSLDLLEMLGVVKRVKKQGDRKLYIQLSGDLLEALKNAIATKLSKSINSSLSDFKDGKTRLKQIPGEESRQVLETIETLESHIKRLKVYVDLLSKTSLPE